MQPNLRTRAASTILWTQVKGSRSGQPLPSPLCHHRNQVEGARGRWPLPSHFHHWGNPGTQHLRRAATAFCTTTRREVTCLERPGDQKAHQPHSSWRVPTSRTGRQGRLGLWKLTSSRTITVWTGVWGICRTGNQLRKNPEFDQRYPWRADFS